MHPHVSMHVKPLRLKRRDVFLGSGLIDHSQKMTAAAMQIADMEVWAHRLVQRVVARYIAPTQSIPDDENDPAEYPPVINPGNVMRQREIRFDPALLRLREQRQIMHGGASPHRQ